MFQSSLFREMEHDPFFEVPHRRIRGLEDPFRPFEDSGEFFPGRSNPLSIEGGEDRGKRHGQGRDVVQRDDRVRTRDPWDFGNYMISSMMGNMNQMMGNMNRLMTELPRDIERVQGDPDSQFYCQSSFMTYDGRGGGNPKVYQASSSTRQVPGGVKETRKSMRDSERGIEKMAVGRHIKDRGHVITKQRNQRTRDIQQNEDFIHLDQTEAENFDREWRERIESCDWRCGEGHRAIGKPRGQRRHQRALEDNCYGRRKP